MRTFLWILGAIVAVPLTVVLLLAGYLFVYAPLKHDWNVYRMDARNAQAWETAMAKVVTVEVEVGDGAEPKKISGEVICYNKYHAEPYNLKDGGPTFRKIAKSKGYQALRVEIETGTFLDVEMPRICARVLNGKPVELPAKLPRSKAYIVSTEQKLYCEFTPAYNADQFFRSNKASVEFPVMVSMREIPLRTIFERDEFNKVVRPPRYSSFHRRWEKDRDSGSAAWRKSRWSSASNCWIGIAGKCSERSASLCGLPRDG